MNTEINIPTQYTLLVPDRNIRFIKRNSYLQNSRGMINIPARASWIIGLIFKTNTILEDVRMKDLYGAPVDMWSLVPASKINIFLPVRMMPHLNQSADYSVDFYTKDCEDEHIDITLSVLEIPDNEMRVPPVTHF